MSWLSKVYKKAQSAQVDSRTHLSTQIAPPPPLHFAAPLISNVANVKSSNVHTSAYQYTKWGTRSKSLYPSTQSDPVAVEI